MKSPIKAPLQHRGLFLRIGFVIALVLVILAFQWKTVYVVKAPQGPKIPEEEMMRPIRTAHKKQKMPDTREMEKIIQPKKSTKIKIVQEKPTGENHVEPHFDSDAPVEIPDLPKPPVEDDPMEPLYLPTELPSFPGGQHAAMRFISGHLRYPEHEREFGIEGTVHVQFVVSRTGQVTDIVIQRSPSPGFSKEARRVLNLMPRWNPGRNNGRFVPVYYNMKIRFSIP